jgi:transcriptional regulator GlxA family with amidase domain
MELSVRGLARGLGCSVAVLERRFREVGDSPAGYRQRVRVAAAIRLLQSSEAKVETVARSVGWKSKKELYKALAKLALMTPTAARRLTLADASALAAQLVR